MKLFLAGVLALALGTRASLFYEWTLYRATMGRMQPGVAVAARIQPHRAGQARRRETEPRPVECRTGPVARRYCTAGHPAAR